LINQKDSEILVSCKGVSKKFCRHLKKSLWYGVKDGVSEICFGQSSSQLRKDEFWALDDVSFELKRGECLGLLGRNGAGKTTLLKVLSGLIKPDKGTITLKGRVGGLIALGAGFNGILSGRENIRINGAILGYARSEIEEKMEEIIEFADLDDFIDAPVQTYSSGMSVRLGFAIAAILTKPDVLLLDEVLAVGDIGFITKCLNTVRKLMKDSAVIFVSHNMQFVSQFCTHSMLLEKGSSSNLNLDIQSGIEEYLNTFDIKVINVESDCLEVSEYEITTTDGTRIECSNGVFKTKQNGKYNLKFSIFSKESLSVSLNIAINDNPSNHVISYRVDQEFTLKKGDNTFSIKLGALELNSGKYSFMVSLSDPITNDCHLRLDNQCPFFVSADKMRWGNVIRSTRVKTIN
jgi:lipopolysaccharide transport system ATP-binding protein